jgi:hypothetical protein
MLELRKMELAAPIPTRVEFLSVCESADVVNGDDI